MSSAICGVRSGPPINGEREELDPLRSELLSLRFIFKVTLAAPGAVVTAYPFSHGISGASFHFPKAAFPPLRPDAITVFTRALSNSTASQSCLLWHWGLARPTGKKVFKAHALYSSGLHSHPSGLMR
ncbi:hypothetical protein NDU88_005102 [Pleurodeles waltl]|uniref:Uncharacterized protein n=1 Tax=Pleurodeles waltl TaxID=8319 RepID=A0AAV7UHY5_PLEWA|nr:hypothetical protein NDU88_005102 [Pleurodeles waltl]